MWNCALDSPQFVLVLSVYNVLGSAFRCLKLKKRRETTNDPGIFMTCELAL